MKMRAYKTEIDPTEMQIEQIKRTQGVCRFVYNLFISTNRDRHKQGLKYMSGYDFAKYLNNEYREEHPEHGWIREVSSKAVKHSIMNAHNAFMSFFKEKKGYPNFKKKHGRPVSMYCPRNSPTAKDAEVQRHRIKVPTLGWMRLKEYGYIPVGYPSSITITYKAGRYYASVLYEMDDPVPAPCTGEGLGVDVGLKTFATVSNRMVYENVNRSKNVKRACKRLKRERRRFSRKLKKRKKMKPAAVTLSDASQMGHTITTSNLDRQRVKVQRAYHRLECIRKDFVNKTVSELVKAKPSYITVEDLCVSGMLKNRHLSRAVSESLFYTFRTTLVRKCRESGIEVRLADRFYPSSKQCSSCGAMRRDLKLSDRVYRCPVCGLEIDRDLNAAMNLKDCTRYCVA